MQDIKGEKKSSSMIIKNWDSKKLEKISLMKNYRFEQ